MRMGVPSSIDLVEDWWLHFALVCPVYLLSAHKMADSSKGILLFVVQSDIDEV